MDAPVRGPRNKHDFYRRWLRGEFGNMPRSWESVEALRASGYNGLLSVRSKTPAGRMETNVPVAEALSRSWHNVVFQETMPDPELVIQASIGYDPSGIWIEYCLEPNINFREAMHRSIQAQGLEALFILKRYVDPSSYDDIMDLVQRFPNAVIEIATFRRHVGVWPHRNTVIFEVREY